MASTKRIIKNPVFLAFEANVLEAFTFLDEDGLKLVDKADYKQDMALQFASEKVSVSVHYEYLNFVWVVITYLEGRRAKSYRLGDLVKYNGISLPKDLGLVKKEEDVKSQIDLAANLLKQASHTILRGDSTTTEILKQTYNDKIKAEKVARAAAKAK